MNTGQQLLMIFTLPLKCRPNRQVLYGSHGMKHWFGFCIAAGAPEVNGHFATSLALAALPEMARRYRADPVH
jgi:hypothetical protein